MSNAFEFSVQRFNPPLAIRSRNDTSMSVWTEVRILASYHLQILKQRPGPNLPRGHPAAFCWAALKPPDVWQREKYLPKFGITITYLPRMGQVTGRSGDPHADRTRV